MASCCGADQEAVAKALESGGARAKALAFMEKAGGVAGSWPSLVISAAALVASFVLAGHGCGGCCGEGAAGALGARKGFDPAIIALVLCGVPILKGAIMALVVEKRIRASLLISIAMIACASIGQLFAAGEVAFIMALGEKLEGWTLSRARQGIKKLVSLVPATAHRVTTCPKCIARGELYKDVPVSALAVGEAVRVMPGETIPVDGKIEEGATTIDQSVMTGESLPVDKAVGDEVYSGTINRYGAITVRITKAGEDSSLQKLVRLVQEAQKRKAPMQRIADRWAAILVPCSLTIALLTFAGVYMVMGDVHTALIRAVTIMVVFCPCALALATPTAIVAAIGQATKYGVIVKSGEALERMGLVTAACLDKTGTLTSGKLAVSDVVAFGGAKEEDVLAYAAAAEESSSHPLAEAICESARARGVRSRGAAADFAMVPGLGVKASVEGREIACGNAKWMRERGIEPGAEAEDAARALQRQGKALVMVALGGKVAGLVALSDTVRDGAAKAVADLRSEGLRPVLLTGDHAESAAFVARGLGIEDVRAGLLPSGKAKEIEQIEAAGEKVCMVGDGVNDALALETATIGIAMGSVGSDIAVEAADIALVGDDLSKIPYLKRLSCACTRLIKFNITISMCINACAITLSILGLLTPVTGALVHNMGSVLVVLNAALLYDRKFR